MSCSPCLASGVYRSSRRAWRMASMSGARVVRLVSRSVKMESGIVAVSHPERGRSARERLGRVLAPPRCALRDARSATVAARGQGSASTGSIARRTPSWGGKGRLRLRAGTRAWRSANHSGVCREKQLSKVLEERPLAGGGVSPVDVLRNRRRREVRGPAFSKRFAGGRERRGRRRGSGWRCGPTPRPRRAGRSASARGARRASSRAGSSCPGRPRLASCSKRLARSSQRCDFSSSRVSAWRAASSARSRERSCRHASIAPSMSRRLPSQRPAISRSRCLRPSRRRCESIARTLTKSTSRSLA